MRSPHVPRQTRKKHQHSTWQYASLPTLVPPARGASYHLNFLPPSCFLLAAPTTQITCKHALPLRWRGTLRADLHLFRILEKVLRETLEANQCWAGPLEPGRIDAHQLERLWLRGRRGRRLARMLPATNEVNRRQYTSEDLQSRVYTHIPCQQADYHGQRLSQRAAIDIQCVQHLRHLAPSPDPTSSGSAGVSPGENRSATNSTIANSESSNKK